MALSALGFEMAVTVLVLGGVGWAIDHYLGSRPWGLLIGLLLGCVVGLLNLVRGALRTMDASPSVRSGRRSGKP